MNFWKIYTFENVNFSRTRKNENLEIIQEYIQYVGQLEYNYKKNLKRIRKITLFLEIQIRL